MSTKYVTRVQYQDCWEEHHVEHATLQEARAYCARLRAGSLGGCAMYHVYGPSGREIDCLTAFGWQSGRQAQMVKRVLENLQEIELREIEDDLPDEYIPTALRLDELPRREQVVYACGYERKPNSFGMFHGPNPDLYEMLEVVPDEPDNSPCLIRFNLDGTDEVLYRWRDGRWVRNRE